MTAGNITFEYDNLDLFKSSKTISVCIDIFDSRMIVIHRTVSASTSVELKDVLN